MQCEDLGFNSYYCRQISHELFISGYSRILFSDCGWVTETTQAEARSWGLVSVLPLTLVGDAVGYGLGVRGNSQLVGMAALLLGDAHFLFPI